MKAKYIEEHRESSSTDKVCGEEQAAIVNSINNLKKGKK